MAGEIVLLDGGMGQELVHRSGDRPTGLWASQIMLDRPELVEAVHADYIAAGASVITLNSYDVHRDRLARNGVEERFEPLHRRAIALAEAARDKAAGDKAAHRVRLAGSIGPLGWSYRPDLAYPMAESVARYAEIAALQAPHVDVIICETVASLDAARAAIRGASGHGVPVWLALTVDDDDGARLRSGEPLAAVADVLATDPAAAVLVNCSTPEAVSVAMPVLSRFGLPFGAYANGFTRIAPEFVRPGATVDLLEARSDLDPDAYADFALAWVENGATIVGGCCEVGPAHIARLRDRLAAAGLAVSTAIPGDPE